MNEPYKTLFAQAFLTVSIESEVSTDLPGTQVITRGHNHNRRELFTHDRLQDHIQWFTKVGSVELFFDKDNTRNFQLHLKGLDSKSRESITFGHIFPAESVEKLFNKYLVDAPKFFVVDW